MTMTRKEFEAKAIKAAEREIMVPAGWWGMWRDVYSPDGARVRFTGAAWIVYQHGVKVSRHDDRAFAIGKARKLKSTKAVR